MTQTLDPALAGWIGRTTVAREAIDARMLREYRATLAPHLGPGEVPPGLFWCLSPDALATEHLGRDGHPRTGVVLPPVPYPRRMWAGGELRFPGTLRPGDEVEKTSRIDEITFKTGSTGPLCFVTVRHTYAVSGTPAVEERQDIVYREEPTGAPAAPPAPKPRQPAVASWTVPTSPVLLFRYSAITFNGHRIHYDHPYATGVEGYGGLVVHGPLQATLMLNLAAQVLGRLPARFVYRGLFPLIAGDPCTVEVAERAEGGLAAAVVSAAGVVTMSAVVEA